MYTRHYGLREKPFALTPDPRFLYLSASHREALAHLLYGIEQGEEDIFPDPMSETMADNWPKSAVKAFEHQFASFVAA